MGIIEADYFGLQFTGAKSENLWLNLRNRICQQMDNVAPCRLRLRVKFFVEPHLILQEQTRYFFFFFLNHADVFGFTGIPSTHLFSRLHLFVSCGERRLHGMSHCCGLSEHDLIAPASDAL